MKSIENIIAEENLVTESRQYYDDVIRVLQEARDSNQPIDEGIIKAVVGGLAGLTAGPSIMKAVAKVLGITENGAMYNLMTSRLCLTALAAYLGYKN